MIVPPPIDDLNHFSILSSISSFGLEKMFLVSLILDKIRSLNMSSITQDIRVFLHFERQRHIWQIIVDI